MSITKLKRIRFIGIICITLLGTLIHYVYGWTGSSDIAAWFFPVNESVWEHLKLGYWAIVLYSIFEYRSVKQKVNNYFLAKTLGMFALQFTILITFYSYSIFTGHNIVIVDILSYVAGAAICQYLTHYIYQIHPLSVSLNRSALAVFIAVGILFGVATFYPPRAPLFLDHNNGTYGIPE